MERSLPLIWLTALTIVGCGTLPGSARNTLSYAQMQAINPGVSALWLLEEYPMAQDVRRRADGSVASMTYRVEDALEDTYDLRLRFDARNILVQKQYTGPFVRPPVPVEDDGPGARTPSASGA